jgi:hypothetical protein
MNFTTQHPPAARKTAITYIADSGRVAVEHWASVVRFRHWNPTNQILSVEGVTSPGRTWYANGCELAQMSELAPYERLDIVSSRTEFHRVGA